MTIAHYILTEAERADGIRQEVSGSFALLGDNQVRFDVGAYDGTQTLVIDPSWVYNTYLGGANDDRGYGVAVVNDGSALITGTTHSPSFRTDDPPPNGAVVPGYAFQATLPLGLSPDIFVAKLNPAGTALTFLTYVGGSGTDEAYDIALDAAANIYLTGETNSNNFPAILALQEYGGAWDAFIVKMAAAGNALTYCSYLGAGQQERGNSIVLDPTFDHVYIAGGAVGGAFHQFTIFGQFSARQPNFDAFVVKLSNPAGAGPQIRALIYLASPDQYDEALGIAVDGNSNAYVTGITRSQNQFPFTPGAFQREKAGGTHDGFLAKLNIPAGAAPTRVYTTYFGGHGDDYARGVIVANGLAYVVGESNTLSAAGFGVGMDTILPTVLFGAGGSFDAYLIKFGVTGDPRQHMQNNPLPYFLWLGSTADDGGWDLCFKNPASPQVMYLTGRVGAADNDLLSRGTLLPYRGQVDAFLAMVDPLVAGNQTVQFFTYFGNMLNDWGRAVISGPTGNAYVAGYTNSQQFTINGVPAFQMMKANPNQDNYDAFAVRVSQLPLP